MTPQTKLKLVWDGVKCFFEFYILVGLFALYTKLETGRFVCGGYIFVAAIIGIWTFVLLYRYRIEADKEAKEKRLRRKPETEESWEN